MSVKKVKQTKVMGHNGVHILISTVQYPNGEYETIALDTSTILDIDMLEGGTLEEHKKAHKDFVEKYGFYVIKEKKEITKVPKKYKDFAKDYIEVVRVLQQEDTYKSLIDGGTCNFDAPMVCLTGYKETLLDAALKEHSKSLRVFKRSQGWFTLSIPRYGSQGEHRTYQAEYIAKGLALKGYNTSVEYRMD